MQGDARQGDAAFGALEVGLDLSFGADGVGRACLGEGWGRPGEQGVPSIGHRGLVRLAMPARAAQAGRWLLEIECEARLAPPALAAQVVAVFLDGMALGRERIESAEALTLGFVVEASASAGALEIRLPSAPEGREVGPGGRARLGILLRRIRLVGVEAPAAVAPRRLPPVCACEGGDRFMNDELRGVIERALGCTPEAMALRFESLGRNCEFGMAQTSLGASPLGLLRFNSCELQPLLGGLECGFADLDDRGLARLKIMHTPRAEWFFVNERYRSVMHTQRWADEHGEAEVLAEVLRSVAYLKVKFRRTLAEADRIFVCQRPGPTPVAQMRPLLARLRAYGANRVLFVSEGGPRRPGVVDDLGGGLLHGAIDHLAGAGGVHCCNLRAWVSLCVNACLAAGEILQS
jgi:hypothetical protein